MLSEELSVRFRHGLASSKMAMTKSLLYYGSVIAADLHEFLVACVGASASFIGPLFVGLSVV